MMPFREPTPEELAEAQRRQQEHEMAVQAHHHSLMGFWDTLSEEQCKSAMAVLVHIIGDPDSVRHFRGYLVGIMERKFGICAACGVDHAAEIAATAPGGDDEEEAPADAG